MTVVNDSDVPRRVLGVRIRRSGGVLTLARHDDAVELSGTGTRIYTLLDGRLPVRDLARELGREYGVGAAEVIDDVKEFLRDLVGRGMVEIGSPTTP